MNVTNRKVRIGGLAAIIGVPAVVFGIFSFAQGGQKVEPSGKKYKNIKVLKDLPSDQLMTVMHKINESLGVKCDFCHVVNASHTGFDLDTIPMKNKAREMIVMTGDIMKNQKTLKGKGSCFMCHHGSQEPVIEATK